MTYVIFVIPQRKIPRLVQITSSGVHKYAIVTFSATMQWHSALHGGTIDDSAHPEGTIWLASSSHRRRSRLIIIRDVYDHADVEFMHCG